MSTIQSQNCQKTFHLLVVEDDVFQRLSLVDLLNLCEYDATSAENGLQARDELLKAENSFDLVLLDLYLPEMNGLELLTFMKGIEKLKDIPVIMMSSNDNQNDLAKCLQIGALDYLVKPIRIQNCRSLKDHMKVRSNAIDNSKSYYQKVKTLGKGANGAVELVRRTLDNEFFALKIIPLCFMDPQEQKYAENEVHLLRELIGPNIIRYYESFMENDSINIIMEYAEGGSLSDIIYEHSVSGKKIEESQILQWMAQLVIAVLLMHSKNILHRDIKTQNMFLTKDNIIKLGGFSNSISLPSQIDYSKKLNGTPYFMSPEVCNGLPQEDKSDIWAMGCALYEMVMLRRPYQEDKLRILIQNIITKPYSPIPETVSKDIRNLVDLLLQKDPNNRPSVFQLVKIPVIEENITIFQKRLESMGINTSQILDITSRLNQMPAQPEIKNFEKQQIKFTLLDAQEIFKKIYLENLLTRMPLIVFKGENLIEDIKNKISNPEHFNFAQQYLFSYGFIKNVSKSNNNEVLEENQLYQFLQDDLTNAANQIYQSTSTSQQPFEIIQKILQLCQSICDAASKANITTDEFKSVYDQFKEQYFSLIYLISETQQIQIDQLCKDQVIPFALNIYQIMVIHQALAKVFDMKLKIMEESKNTHYIINFIKTNIPYFNMNDYKFFYVFKKIKLTIDDIKHGILRENKKHSQSNFVPWGKEDEKLQFVQKLDERIFVLFHQFEQLEKQPIILQNENQEAFKCSLHQLGQAKITYFNLENTSQALQTITKPFLNRKVCIDDCENEIIIPTIFETYLSDFANNKIFLMEWILEYLGKNISKEDTIKAIKNERFNVKFSDDC